MSTLFINDEQCRLIKGYERYHISESGRIYRSTPLSKMERDLKHEGTLYFKEMTLAFRELNGKIRQGFCSLTHIDGTFHNTAVAPLVVEAFSKLPSRYNGRNSTIEFIDGDKRNLHISNLKVSDTKGKNSKLTKTQVRTIKKRISEGASLKELSRDYGVSDMQINRIKTGENWGNGKRKIEAPKAPFPIEDGKIRRFVALFQREEMDPNIRKQFYIKRNPDVPTDNLIVGIFKGYKLSHTHVNITRARVLVDMLNDYFFTAKKMDEPVFNEFYKSFDT